MDDTTLAIACVVTALDCAGWACYVAIVKNRAWYEGLAAGIMLGPFGVVVMACMPTLEAKPAPMPYEEQVKALSRSRDDDDDEKMRRYRERQPGPEPPATAPKPEPRLSDAEWAKRTPPGRGLRL